MRNGSLLTVLPTIFSLLLIIQLNKFELAVLGTNSDASTSEPQQDYPFDVFLKSVCQRLQKLDGLFLKNASLMKLRQLVAENGKSVRLSEIGFSILILHITVNTINCKNEYFY